MNIKEFLNSIDVDSIQPQCFQDTEYIDKVIRQAKLAIYLSNYLPHGIIKGITKINKDLL